MKCPKCGYVSFDHNQACPKCKKDISEERNKLNLPDFEPAVPFLLGALTGETEEAGMNIDISPGGPAIASAAEAVAVEEEIPILEEEEEVASLDEDLEISLEEDWTPEEMEEEESVIDEDFSDLETSEGLGAAEPEEDLSLELEDEEESVVDEGDLDLSGVEEGTGEGVEEDEISLDLEELSPEVGAAEEAEQEQATGPGTDEDLSLDLEELQPEEEVAEEIEPMPSSEADEDLSLDLDELGLDEEEFTEDVIFEDSSPTEEEQEPEIELESIALGEEEEKAAPEEEEEEVVLNLDDLKINETGELEIGSPEMQEALGGEDGNETIDLEGIELEETEGEEGPTEVAVESGEPEDFTMNLDDLSLEKAPKASSGAEDELSLDLDDLELDLDLEEEEPKSS